MCKKIKKEDGEVDFCDAKALVLKYKAYSFWPGVFLSSGLKLKGLTLRDETSTHQAGEILEIHQESILIGCRKGSLEIKTLQAPSKKEVSSVDYLRGQRLQVGDILA